MFNKSIATERDLGAGLALLSSGSADGYLVSADMLTANGAMADAPIGAPVALKNSLSAGRLKNDRVLRNDSNTDFAAKQTLDTLTAISTEIIRQKRYMPDIEGFMPLAAGKQPYLDSILTYKQFGTSSDPERGFINVNNTGQFQEPDVAYDAVTIKRKFWAEQISWNFLQQNQIMANAASLDIVADKLGEMAKDHKQLTQGIAFYGSADGVLTGLLNASGVTVNTTLIAKQLYTMTAAELNTFAATVVAAYRTANGIFETPDTFLLPLYDHDGLATFVSTDFPMAGNTKLAYLESVFKTITQKPNFKIIGTPYCNKTGNGGWAGHFGRNPLSKDRYVLYQNDVDTLDFDMPIPFSMLGTGTANNANFVNIAFCQVGQVFVKRTQNILYMDNNNS